jgi:hypothetical protein
MNSKSLLVTGALVASGLTVAPPATASPSDVQLQQVQQSQACGAPRALAATFDIDQYLAARKAALSVQRLRRP